MILDFATDPTFIGLGIDAELSGATAVRPAPLRHQTNFPNIDQFSP